VGLGRKVYEELPEYDSEQEFVDSVLAELDAHFHIWRQVPLKHWTGQRFRVDAVMQPRDPDQWKDEHPVFAVEFKMPLAFHTDHDRWGATKDFTAWAAQAVDYANSLWEGSSPQRLRIFACPSVTAPFEAIGPSDIDSPTLTTPSFYMSRLLWQLGVGELAKLVGDGWTLLGQGDHVLWSQRRGVHEGKRWSLTPKAGSR